VTRKRAGKKGGSSKRREWGKIKIHEKARTGTQKTQGIHPTGDKEKKRFAKKFLPRNPGEAQNVRQKGVGGPDTNPTYNYFRDENADKERCTGQKKTAN